MAITILAGTNEIKEDEEERKKARKGKVGAMIQTKVFDD
jgi:hypothetical protein